MCQREADAGLAALVQQATSGTTGSGATVLALPPAAPAQGSRRRRLWELDSHAHCPVVGVCLPMAQLRRVVDKVLSGQALADDYELHCGAIAECRLRTPVAEAVQRELDRRYTLLLQQSAKAKTPEALAQWWRQTSQRSQQLAGAFWATLTHPRCTPELEHQVLGEVHMLQHQVGMAQRVDVERFDALVNEHAELQRELAAAHQRHVRQAEEHQRLLEAAQSQVVQLRAQLIGRDTTVAGLKEDLAALEAAAPALRSRQELTRQNQRQAERLQQLERALQAAQLDAERQRRRADELAQTAASAQTATDSVSTETPLAAIHLDDQAVLCVGGRPASVPLYRHLVERTGGRFLHHDGGEEDNPARLDATLDSADLVICQTGCISHDAYWRVKDHCKRTGKRCVFVDSPSSNSLKRALRLLQPDTAPQPG